jgi:hypothetical protein
MIIMGTLPPTHVFNFASTFTVVGLLTIIIASLAAVSYSTLLASRIITPSLERRWKLKTKPKGDEWDIALPTSATSLEETRGILAYLYEYYTGARALATMKDLKFGLSLGLATRPPHAVSCTSASSSSKYLFVSSTQDINII